MKKSFILEKIVENSKNNIANFHIGMIIKKKRLERKMTLEETTKGICCVSYLSKLEHGIIEPKRYVMEEVLERLKVKQTALRSTAEYDKLLLDCLKAIKDENKEKVDEIYLSLSDDDDIHFADILRAAYYLVNNDYQLAIRIIEKTLSVKEHLDNQEIITIILLTAIYNYKNNEFAESLDCCLLLDDYYNMTDLHTNILRLRLIIENKYVLGEYSTLYDYVSNYQVQCTKSGDNKGVTRSYYLYSMALANEKHKYEALKVYDNIAGSLDEEYRKSWKKDLLLAFGSFDELGEYELSPLEKLRVYDEIGETQKLLEVLTNIDDTNFTVLEHIFLESIKKKYVEGEYYYLTYLRKTAFCYAIEHGMYNQGIYYGGLLIKLFVKNNRYKEAIQIYEKISAIHNLRWKI